MSLSVQDYLDKVYINLHPEISIEIKESFTKFDKIYNIDFNRIVKIKINFKNRG